MNVVMNYSKSESMLQLAIFPEKEDACQDIQHVQGRINTADIKSIVKMIESQIQFPVCHKTIFTSSGYVYLEDIWEGNIRLYMMGGCLTMNLKTLEDVLKQLEKI